MSTPEAPDDLLAMIPLRRVVARRVSQFQDVAVVDLREHGRALILDGTLQSAEVDEACYHEPFVHPVMLLHGRPRRILIAGAGEGATLREVLRHPSVEDVLAVEIDPVVVALCREHLPSWHAGSFDDPRVRLQLEDIRATLDALPPESVDVAFLDLTDPVDPWERRGRAPGPADELLTPAFYRQLARALAADGLLAVQIGELHPHVADATEAALAHLRAVFPWVVVGHTWVDSFNSTWGFALASQRPRSLAPDDLDARIAALGPLRVYDADRHRAFFERVDDQTLVDAKWYADLDE